MHLLRKKSFLALIAILGIVFLSLPVKAQDYTDEELQNFADVIVEVINIQQQSQMQMISIIEENEMSIQRFNEMMIESQEKPVEELEASEEEKEKFADISVEIMAIQEDMEERLVASVEDGGLTIERYEEILSDYQQNPELQKRVQELVE